MKAYLREQVLAGLRSAGLSESALPTFEKPRQADHGDLTTNIAMVLAKPAGLPPRELAQRLVSHLAIDRSLVDRIEIAGPGFINFRFTPKFFQEQTGAILRERDSYGRCNAGAGSKTQVEFVSANPTGPLTVGHGRGAVFGDTVARLLEWTGHAVPREYYFNNAGRQMRILGDSVRLRYRELIGMTEPFPDDYYQGEYIREIARHILTEKGDGLGDEPADGIFRQQAEREIFDDIKNTLSRLGIRHDVYFNENTLYEQGHVEEVIAEFRRRGLAYEQEGAVWLKMTALGAEKDKVIVKSTGEPTYRLPDIAYHREKLRRGFDRIIDVLGADHIASYPDVLAGLTALGEDPKKITVLIHQFVTILQDGEVVKMSTRKANFITLDELIDAVSADVVRYFFLMRGIASHLNFDLALAREKSDKNPVYYLQYAHARIASIVRHAADTGVDVEAPADLAGLTEAEELDLMKKLVLFPEMVESCAATFEPHRLAEYLHDVAGAFHKFYHFHRVVTDDRPQMTARLALCRATTTVLKNGLSILGIRAPEQM